VGICFKFETVLRGLKVVLAGSACLLIGLIVSFVFVSQRVLNIMPNLLGFCISVALGLTTIYIAASVLHVIVDSALILRNPGLLAERGLDICV